MDLKLETRRRLKEQGLKSYINSHGEYYNCVDVANFFETLEQKLAESEKDNKEMSETIKTIEKNYNAEAKATVVRCLGAQANKYFELEQKLSEALEVIRFYGDHNNWLDNDLLGTTPSIVNDSQFGNEFGESDHLTVGGKRAREFLKKHEVKDGQ